MQAKRYILFFFVLVGWFSSFVHASDAAEVTDVDMGFESGYRVEFRRGQEPFRKFTWTLETSACFLEEMGFPRKGWYQILCNCFKERDVSEWDGVDTVVITRADAESGDSFFALYETLAKKLSLKNVFLKNVGIAGKEKDFMKMNHKLERLSISDKTEIDCWAFVCGASFALRFTEINVLTPEHSIIIMGSDLPTVNVNGSLCIDLKYQDVPKFEYIRKDRVSLEWDVRRVGS